MWNCTVWKKRIASAGSMKKADIILIILCLLASVLLGMFFILFRGQGSTAVLSYDGAEISVINLSESGMTYYLVRKTDQGIVVETYELYPELPVEGDFNLFSVSNGSVNMAAADCKDQICVHHRPIAAIGESVICLPHRLVVEITDRAMPYDIMLDGVVE